MLGIFFFVIAVAGFGVSLVAHILAFQRIPIVTDGMVATLHVGMLALALPMAAMTSTAIQNSEVSRREYGRIAFPKGAMIAWMVLFAYVLGTVGYMFYLKFSGYHAADEIESRCLAVRTFSPVWLFLYFMEALLFRAVIILTKRYENSGDTNRKNHGR